MKRLPLAISAAPLALFLGMSACSNGSGSVSSRRSGSDGANARQAIAVQTPRTRALPSRTVRFAARDYGFDGPKRVEAGLVRLELTNHGVQPHQLALFRLKPGVAPGTVLGALAAAKNLEAGRPYGTWIAGPNGIRSHQTGSMVVDLRRGSYLLACLMPAPDGAMHAVKGMLGTLEVTTPASMENDAASAHGAATIDANLPVATLSEYVFLLPKGFGRGSFRVHNAGTQVHELALVRLHDGMTFDDVRAYEATPAEKRSGARPYDDALGATFLDPNQDTRLDLNLPKGNYAALCFIPTPEGTPHFRHGMAAPFTVS